MTTTDRWHCDWCGYQHPVATMVTDHQATCVAKPADTRVA